MMREIKFRAWLKRGFIVDVVSIDFENRYITWDDGQISRSEPPDKEYEIEPFKDIELLEYTGIKDIHGHEIYEGYLVRYTIPEDVPENERDVRKVIWVDGMCGFQGRTLNDRFECFLDTETFEIIGNIYENPELLKAE